jgi:hypothetical protein
MNRQRSSCSGVFVVALLISALAGPVVFTTPALANYIGDMTISSVSAAVAGGPLSVSFSYGVGHDHTATTVWQIRMRSILTGERVVVASGGWSFTPNYGWKYYSYKCGWFSWCDGWYWGPLWTYGFYGTGWTFQAPGTPGQYVIEVLALHSTEGYWSTSDGYPTFCSFDEANSCRIYAEASVWLAPPAPVASAGLDRSVGEGTKVFLDGTASRDPFGQALVFSWTQLPTVTVGLIDANTPTPSFTAPYIGANQTLTFRLTVRDPDGYIGSDDVNVTIVNTNNAPIADAGDDGTVKPGGVARLDGSHSYDPDGEAVSFQWSQTAGPQVTVDVPEADPARPRFVLLATDAVTVGQAIEFELKVFDGKEWSAPDRVAVRIVENSAPVANAGDPQTVDEGRVVHLDGTASADPDGDTLSFSWEQVPGAGPPVILVGADGARPQFTAPAVAPGGETIKLRLTVSDNDPVNPKAASTDLSVAIRNINDPPSCDLARPSVPVLWPPDHRMVLVGIEGVTDRDSLYNRVTLTITSVYQDEVTDGLGDGDTAPDALRSGDRSGVLLRAERSGTGDGRYYTVNFSASDGFEECVGRVRVAVPHDRKTVPIDSGVKAVSLE